MRKAILLFLLLTMTAVAQQPTLQQPQQKPPAPGKPVTDDQPYTLTVNTQLVVETVVVTDPKGNPIEDLTAKDFTVTEDGVPQNISVFEYQKLDDDPLPPMTSATEPTSAAAPAEPPKPPAPSMMGSGIAPEKAGVINYQDRRLLVIYFDMTGMPDVDQLRAFEAGEKFIRTQMSGADMMAVMSFSGGAVRVLQDFTNDRDKLLGAIDKLIVGEGQGFDETISDASASDTGTAFGQDDSEFNIFNTDRQLAALQTAVTMLRTLNEQKSLIYFASGLQLNGLDNQAQLHATENAAIRANVKLFPVDARGLVAMPPMGDASRGSPGGVNMFSGASMMAGMSNFQRSQDTLYTLAADTGGKAMLDSNDLAAGIVNAQKAIKSYYIIGYYTTNPNLDGKFRKINIALKEIPSKLAYRPGYYAGKEFSKFTLADKERQLEEAFMLGDPITELTIAMEINYFRLNNAESYVPLMVKIPGFEFALAKKGGAQRSAIDFLIEVKDEYGTTMQNLRDKIDMKISDKTAAELAKVPIEYDTGFTELPGKYVIKVLARDAETGRIGTYQANFTVPNLAKEQLRVPISSVVLSSQRVDMRDALYNASKKDVAQDANPLVEGGQKLIPSVTRVFSKSKDMYVYLQAYELAATSMDPLVAFVTFYRGQTKAFETDPIVFNDGMNPKSKAIPLRFDLALSQLPVGEYRCQVTVLKPNEQKATFWQANVVLVP